MEYREIVAVTGLGGLFQLLATKSDGAIVRNLSDKSTKFIPARLHNVTPLESIEVYTTSDNVRLHEVFQKMKDNESAVQPVDPKKTDGAAITAYFKGIFPEFDEERVYVSDMKKMLKWYELLKANDLLNFESMQPQEAEAEEGDTEEEKPAKKAAKKADSADNEEAEEKPAKKAPAKKAAAKDGEEKPAKKAAAKKAVAKDGEEKPAKKTAAKKKTEE